METTNKFARRAMNQISKSFKESRYGSKISQNLLRAGMMKDRCRASGKLSDTY